MRQKQLAVSVTDAQADWLRRQAAREHRSLSQQIALYIDYGIHEHERLSNFVRPLDAPCEDDFDAHDYRR